MRVYRFDPESGFFLGAADLDDSDRDPRAPENFLIPGDATDIPPPEECPPGHAPMFHEGRWVVLPRAVPRAGTIAAAQAARAECDRVAIECVKAARKYPKEWRDFDRAALAILRADPAAPIPALPPRPALPAFLSE